MQKTIQTTVGKASFLIRTESEPFPDPEFEDVQGSATLVVSGEAFEALKGVEHIQYNAQQVGSSYPLQDLDEAAVEGQMRLDTTDTIAAIAYLGELGGAWELEWISPEGSLFWLFHDLDHARNDWSANTEAKEVEGSIELYPDHEDRAHFNGTREAVKNGMGLDQCISEIVRAQESFSNSFNGQRSQALGMIFQHCTLNV